MSVMGCKANVGHTEPTAGATGLLQLMAAMHDSVACPNAQLRVLNPRVEAAMKERSPSLPVQCEAVQMSATGYIGGVSSFGLSGTIAHAVVSILADHGDDGSFGTVAHAVLRSCGQGTHPARRGVTDVLFRRHLFPWSDPAHQFTSHSMNTERTRKEDGDLLMHSARWLVQPPKTMYRPVLLPPACC